MTASPSSSTMVRSDRILGFWAGMLSGHPVDELGVIELEQDPLDVFGHDLWGEARHVADGDHHLVRHGLAIAQIPDGQRRLVQQVHVAGAWVVHGDLILGVAQPHILAPNGPALSNREIHRSTPTRSSRIPYWMTKAAASSRECTPSLPSTFWMWVRAVLGLMTSAWAIPSLSCPSARKARTSFSLLVSREMRWRASSCSRRRRIRRDRREPSMRRGIRVSPRCTARVASISSERGHSFVR